MTHEDPNTLVIGTVRKDEKKNRWVVVSGTSGNKWTLYKRKSEKERIIQTHFNMSRPYKIRMTRRNMIIYPNHRSSSSVMYLRSYKRVFIGVGLYIFDQEKNKRILTKPISSLGNSILVFYRKINNHYQYVWIGDHILTFMLKEPIVTFKSPLVGADVPYPSAETKSNIYLISTTDNYIIPKEEVKNIEHIYDWFYGLTNQQKNSMDKYKIYNIS